MVDPQTIESRIREGIAATIGYEQELTRDESLRHAAVFDSSNMLEFIGFLEDAFTIELANDDMVQENFETIASITSFVGRKVQQARAAAA